MPPHPADTPLAKIIATVGPASRERDVLEKLIEAGASIFRLNFSHGDLETHERTLDRIRAAADSAHRPIAVLGDLRGPKIRIGRVPEPGVELRPGDRVTFTRGSCEARRANDEVTLCTTYERFVEDVQLGERVLIDDGRIRLLAVDRDAQSITCAVTIGGTVTSGKGINLPQSRITAPALGDYDRECVRWAVAHDVDFLALSFVRSEREIIELRREIESAGSPVQDESPIQIVAKIELPAAVAGIDAILDAADAIMVARGDLGVEMDVTRVPVIQKQLIEAAQAHGKPVIVATQMLESMVEAPIPTRAEVSDIATAIFAAVDAVMLSGETAIGSYPVLAVDHMRLTALHTEEHMATQPHRAAPPERLVESRYRTAALAHAAWTLSQDCGARSVVVWSQLGGGARLLSQNNFCIPIVAVSSDERALRRMQLLRGVRPVHMTVPPNRAEFVKRIEKIIIEFEWGAPGDRYVLMDGPTYGKPKVTDRISMREIGSAASPV